MKIAEALAHGRDQLHTSPTPQLDARLLLQHILQVNHSYLIAHNDQALTDEQEAQFNQLLQRAQKQEPIPYIIGTAPFFDFDLIVSPAVLIPRPETELLVETAVTWAKTHDQPHIVDVGTGSGCIAIALARRLPQAHLTAVDISSNALSIAQQNAASHAPNRIRFHEGSLLTPTSGQIDSIVANLPYVTDGEWTALDDGVKWYEPSLALKGGEDGLDIIRELLKQAQSRLSTSGAIFLEIGWKQGRDVQQLARSFFPNASVSVIPDLAGHDRIIAIES